MQNLIPIREAYFSKGMNDRVKPELLDKGYCADALNCFLEKEKITMRTGYTAVGNDQNIDKPILGMGGMELANGNKFVYEVRDDSTSTNAHIRYWTGSGNWTALTSPTALTASLTCEFEAAQNAIYVFNGTDTVHKITTGDTDSTVAAIPKGKYARWFHQFLFVIGTSGNPNRLYFSNINAPDTWTAADYIDINADDGDVVTGLNILKDELLVSKKQRVWSLTGFGTATFTLANLNERITGFGATSHRSMINIGDDVLYMSFQGGIPHIRSIQRTRFGTLVDGGIVSGNIEATMDGISKTALSTCAAGFDGRRVWFAVANSGSGTNNLVLVKDVIGQKLDDGWTRHTGIKASVFLNFAISSQRQLYFGEAGNDAQVYRFDGATSDNGAAISFQYISRKFTPAIERRCKWKYLYLDQDGNSTGYSLTVDLSPDGYTYNSLGTVSNSTAGSLWGTMVWGTGKWGAPTLMRERLTIPNTIANGVQVKFSNSTLNASIAIRNFELFYKPKGLRDL